MKASCWNTFWFSQLKKDILGNHKEKLNFFLSVTYMEIWPSKLHKKPLSNHFLIQNIQINYFRSQNVCKLNMSSLSATSHLSALDILRLSRWRVCTYYMCWLSSSTYQHIKSIIYLKSSCFDRRNGAYDECRERRESACVLMCVRAFLFPSPHCFSLRDNWVPGGSIWSAEEWFPFIICHQFQQGLSGEAVSEARRTFQSDRWCWIVNRDQSLSKAYFLCVWLSREVTLVLFTTPCWSLWQNCDAAVVK